MKKWFYPLQTLAAETLEKIYPKETYEKYCSFQVLSTYDVFEQYDFVREGDEPHKPIKTTVMVHMVKNHDKAGSIFIHELNTIASNHKSFKEDLVVS